MQECKNSVMMMLVTIMVTRTKWVDPNQHYCPPNTMLDLSKSHTTRMWHYKPYFLLLGGSDHMVVACGPSGEQECSSMSKDMEVSLLGALTIFLFLLWKIDTTLRVVCLLLTVIYNHMKYGNVHLQITADGALFGHHCFIPFWVGVIHH